MKAKDFDKIARDTTIKCLEVLTRKSKEYTTIEDRLSNFKGAAALQHCTVEQAIAGFMAKHTVSIYDMVDSGVEYGLDKWDEKIIDHINYLLILRAALEESVNK